VRKSGPGAGTITSVPAGISCGSACVASYANGTTVTLTATPAGKSRFQGWTGDCSGRSACVLTMSSNHFVGATFTKPLAPPSCVVPNVVGKKLTAARAAIVHAHCKVGTLTRKTSSARKRGKVLAQSPRAGRKLRNGAKVNLTVGK
jgi:hypothetical protein